MNTGCTDSTHITNKTGERITDYIDVSMKENIHVVHFSLDTYPMLE